MIANTLHGTRNRGLSKQLSARSMRRRTSRRRLLLESLETRRLLATITVTNLTDSIDTDPQSTSLREALIRANADLGHDTIQFSPLLFNAGPKVIRLGGNVAPSQGSHLFINESVTIRGPGADKLTIDANRQARHFTVISDDATFVEAEISGVTLTQGFAPVGGGAIFVVDAELTVTESEITGNTASDDGGGILLEAELKRPGAQVPALIIDHSTIALNRVLGDTGHGGGISVVGFPDQNDQSKTIEPDLEIDNSTISNNSAEGESGAFFLERADAVLRHVTITGNRTNSDGDSFDPSLRIADVTLVNTIVAGNFLGPGTTPFDVTIPVDTNASKNNLIGDAGSSGGLRDGVMGNIVGVGGFGVRPIGEILDTILRNNGGTTRTHALVPGSVAIDAAMPLLPRDQRDERRPKGVASDIGSFEADADTVRIEATTDGSEAGPTDGRFTVTQSASRGVDLVISYSVTGTADAGDDYTALSGSVTILASTLSATIDVPAIDDSLVEELETVIVTLDSITSGGPGVSIDSSSDEATISLEDNDSAMVTIAATTNGDESGPTNGVFTVTQTAASSTATTIRYSVIGGTAMSGTDFTALSGTVTIPANGTSATIDVPVLVDALVEGTETLTLRLDSIMAGDTEITVGAADEATLEIGDNNTATVAIARLTDGQEGSLINGSFTVTQSSRSTIATVISYTVTGTATSGEDYTPLSGSVTIPANSASAAINVPTIDDAMAEETETVIVTLDSITSGNTERISIDSANDSASINIVDNDQNVNKQPSFTASNPPTVQANAGPQTVTGFATFDPGDPSESSQSVLNYTVSNVNNVALFAVLPAIDNDGNLTYTPAVDEVGMSDFTVVVQDDGGTANGGVDTSGPQTFTITVTAVQDAVLDVTGSGNANPFQDGIIMVRFMLGQPNANLEDPALIPPGSTRTTGDELRAHLEAAGDALDANGDGMINPFEDGVLIIRFLLGQPDANLEDPILIPAGSTRTTGAAIRQYLETLLPPPSESASIAPPPRMINDRLADAEAESQLVSTAQRIPATKKSATKKPTNIPNDRVDAVDAALRNETDPTGAGGDTRETMSLDDAIELLSSQ